jgi:hypothetical protein
LLEPIAVLGEGGRNPHSVVNPDRQPSDTAGCNQAAPSTGAPNRCRKCLQQQRAQQLLWRNREAALDRIELGKIAAIAENSESGVEPIS